MNSAWYFSTREGDEGPYATQAVAEREAGRYKMEVTTLSGFQQSRGNKRPQPVPTARERRLKTLRESAEPRSDRILALSKSAEPRNDLILDLVEYEIPVAS